MQWLVYLAGRVSRLGRFLVAAWVLQSQETVLLWQGHLSMGQRQLGTRRPVLGADSIDWGWMGTAVA